MSDDKPARGPLQPEMDMEAIRAAFAGLNEGLKVVGAALAAGAKRNKEHREVAALFGVYREMRRASEKARQGELDGMLRAALDGYDTELLSDLIVFADFLDREALPVWESRTR